MTYAHPRWEGIRPFDHLPSLGKHPEHLPETQDDYGTLTLKQLLTAITSQEATLKVRWPVSSDQIGMEEGGVGRESLDSGLPWSLGPGRQNPTFSHSHGTRKFCSFHWTMEGLMEDPG